MLSAYWVIGFFSLQILCACFKKFRRGEFLACKVEKKRLFDTENFQCALVLGRRKEREQTATGLSSGEQKNYPQVQITKGVTHSDMHFWVHFFSFSSVVYEATA